jgi:nucleotide-binding universal stress UspA family protein
MKKKAGKGPILVPVDFSPCSEHALAFAGEIAACMDASIMVLHVVHDPGEAPGYYHVRGRKKQIRRMEEVAGDMLRSFIDQMATKHRDTKSLQAIEGKLVVGLPVTRILEVVDRFKPFLVVMGSKGRTGLSHVLLGSKAEQVVHLCPVPVTIVKEPKS